MSLLHKTNARLCDQVEVFDAVAADNATDAAGYDRKASKISQLRRELEEENQKLQSRSVRREQEVISLSDSTDYKN